MPDFAARRLHGEDTRVPVAAAVRTTHVNATTPAAARAVSGLGMHIHGRRWTFRGSRQKSV